MESEKKLTPISFRPGETVGVDANGFSPVSLDEVLAWFDGVPCSGRVDWRNWVNETGSKAVSRKLAGCK